MTSISRAFSIESATAASARVRGSVLALSDVGVVAARVLLAPVSGAAASRACRMLSLWARSAANCASAAWASASSPAGEQPARAASRANPSRALRATGLSLRGGRLDEGADLELGLQQGAAGVAQGLGRGQVGRR